MGKLSKELLDQPLHFLMGMIGVLIVSLPLSLVISVYLAALTGMIVSRLAWTFREWLQHKDHDHDFEWYGTLDLNFIDAGVGFGFVSTLFIYLKWMA